MDSVPILLVEEFMLVCSKRSGGNMSKMKLTNFLWILITLNHWDSYLYIHLLNYCIVNYKGKGLCVVYMAIPNYRGVWDCSLDLCPVIIQLLWKKRAAFDGELLIATKALLCFPVSCCWECVEEKAAAFCFHYPIGTLPVCRMSVLGFLLALYIPLP